MGLGAEVLEMCRSSIHNADRLTVTLAPVLSVSIEALSGGGILAAGLDVFEDEPNVPAELMALENAILLPHVGSASVFTRDAMGDLVVSNLVCWFRDNRPLTPVPETPWPRENS